MPAAYTDARMFPVRRRLPIRAHWPALAASVLIGIAGCGGLPRATEPSIAVYTRETFEPDSQYARRFPTSPAATCEAVRRALLSQGYVIGIASADRIGGRKNFQPQRDAHLQLEFNVTCAGEGPSGQGPSIVFASAIEDRYALKKAAGQSASVGVGPLGSVSLPLGSSDDSLVKVGSATVPAGEFYDRFFRLVEYYLDTDAEPASEGRAPAPSDGRPPMPAEGKAPLPAEPPAK